MNKKGYAISQISLLILGIFAIAFIVGGMSTVDAAVGEECKVEGSATGCDDGEICKKTTEGYKCQKEEASASGEDGDGSSVGDTVSKASQGIATLNGAVNAPKNTKKLLRQVGLLKKEVAAGEAAVEAAAQEVAISETLAKNGMFKLFGNEVYLTKSAAETAAGADLAAVLPTESAFVLGEGAITSGGFFHGAMVVASYAAISAAAGLVAGGIARYVFGASGDQTEVVGYTAAGSTFVGMVAVGLGASGPVGWAIGGTIAAVGILFGYKTESTEIVVYQCLSYVPPTGGDDCEACNGGDLPCTEYQCKSLGRACELVNRGTGDELCIHNSRNDTRPPQIEAWKEVLYDDYIYNPITTNFPEDRGVRVVDSTSGTDCVRPFEDVKFGVTLDEPAICKYSNNRSASWEDMGSDYFSRGMSAYNHSMSMSYLDKGSVEAEGFDYEEYIEGFNEFFVRCEDANGNRNSANFVFRFCVDESPDLSTPVILNTEPLKNSYIKFNQSALNATFYVNKPSACKWDHVDRAYNDMENEMSCEETVGGATEHRNRMVYPCETELKGLANYEENDFYVRCKSYPQKNETERITMERSDVFTLRGTRPLTITEVYPNETLRGSSDIMNIELYIRTGGGATDEGDSTCYFSREDKDGKYVAFHNTNSYEHTQDLWLSAGAYKYYIKCVDQGGNIEETETSFVVESDTSEPLVARAYSEDGFLKIATNEESRCVYSTFGCDYSFDDGTSMSHNEYVSHFTPWDSSMNLYVKCEDVYGNRPLAQDECSIVIRAYDEFVDPNN